MILLPGFFMARPNRFVVEAVLMNGRRVRAHLADPGRLRELLIPGAPLRLRPTLPGRTRKTRYTVALVRSPDTSRVWVSVDTTLPNRLAEDLFIQGRVHGIGRGWTLRREVRRGHSRFDFLLSGKDQELLVEVKSVTLVENGIARFPDAPTARGTRHVQALEKIVQDGGQAMILFVVQRSDAHVVVSNARTDPDFAASLISAHRSGVMLRAARFRLLPTGRADYLGPLPVRTR